jgi:NTE family protein
VIPQSPLEARFGIFFSTTGLAQTYLGFSYRELSEVSTHLKGSVQFGRLYDGVNLGFRFDYPSRIPLFFQGNFNYNGIDYNSYNTNFFFEDLKPAYITEDEINIRFDVGVPYSMSGVLKAGLGIGRNKEVYYMTNEFSSTDTSEVSIVNNLSLYAAMESNTMNNKQFATEGVYKLHAIRAGYGSEAYFPGSTSETEQNEKKEYFWFSAKYENRGYLPLDQRFNLGYYMHLHASFRPLLSNYYSTLIEAPVFKPNIITKSLFMEHYRANQFIAFGVMPVYNFSKQFHAKAEAYAFFPVQEIRRDIQNEAYLSPYFNTMKTLFDASLNFVTVAGPVSFHVGYITEEDKPWVFQLSFGYLLFNKRSVDE